MPILEEDGAAIELAHLLDGLIVTGGPAIEDGLIGELPEDISPTDPRRLESDKKILGAFLESQKPVLGICYGMQLANALRGGRIYADVETQMEGAAIHSQKRGGTSHSVGVALNSILHDILKTDTLNVNTRHIQAIEQPGRGLRIAATAPDGVIEAIESPDGSFVGVQFHPERMGEVGDALFAYLVQQAQQG